MRELPAQPNQSLIDGLACLQTIASSLAPMGSRELARKLAMEPTRTNRLVKTLAHLGMAARNADRKYTAGPAIHVLSTQTLRASGLLRKALPVLRDLQKLRFLVALGVLWKDHVSYLCHALPDRPIEEGIGRFAHYPATLSSIGMVLLSAKPEQEVRRLYRGKDIPRYGRKLGSLLRDLRRARTRGYAAIDEENGKTTAAVPVGEPPIAAVAVSGAGVRRCLAKCVETLKQAAEYLSQQEPAITGRER